MNKALRTLAVDLRVNKRMSYSAISKQLGVAKSTLSYWLKEFSLSEEEIRVLRRNGWAKGEASRERFRNTMKEKNRNDADIMYKNSVEKIKKMPKEILYSAGLMLYAAEGAKKDPYRIILVNTDANIITFFICWLEKYLRIKKEKLRFQLHLYETMNIEKEVNYWIQGLKITKKQLYKPQIRSFKKNSFTYQSDEKNRHGTCSLQYSNKKHKLELMMDIKAFLGLHT